MAQIADIVGKILLFGVIKAPAEEVISINCTKEEIKILGTGKASKVLTVKAHKFSESAKKALEAAGSKIEYLTK